MYKKSLLLLSCSLVSFTSIAQLELTKQYQDWQRYEATSFDGKSTVMLGVTEPKKSDVSDTVALRCTTEGINLLFFNSVSRENPGYQARASIDSQSAFTMDVWIKGSTHWATVPEHYLTQFQNGKLLSVELQGDNRSDNVVLSLKGFSNMHQALKPTCIESS